VELDPSNDENSAALEKRYVEAERHDDLAGMLLKRAETVTDRAKRIELRTRAAKIQRDQLDNMEAARESLLKVLEDGDDEGALMLLVDDAEGREEYQEATSLLRRLGDSTKDPAKKLEARLREAKMLAERIDDVDGAVSRYESVLSELDSKNREALSAIAELEERRDNPEGAAKALERELLLVDGEGKIEIARRLATLYEGPLDNPEAAVKVLEIVVAGDEEDFEAIARLCELTEKTESYPRTAELLRKLIEVEGDEEEISNLSRRLARILEDKIGKGDEALSALEGPADSGDAACREAYVELGDKLGWKGIVATKLVAWNEARGASPERNAALRGAFDRFVSIGRDTDAARVAMELARAKNADPDLAKKLEEIGIRAKDLDALQTAHDLLVKDLSGGARAEELVRQAEVLLAAGVDPIEAMQHGEAGLASVPAGEAEPLLARLAALAPAPNHAIDVYERQVSRAKLPPDRLRALARAAQVASERGALDRAKGFFELSLSGGAQEDTLAALEDAAREADGEATELRRTLAEAFAGGGQGSRDGGRTRSALLRRAARLAQNDLNDIDRAFTWLGDALVAYVDAASLDALETLGRDVSDLARVEATLSRALGEVFDGPLVKQLLARRASLRKSVLDDKTGAAQDLKKLHDLAPSDQAVMEELSQLLTELRDFRGMVQVLEDQILRGKDPAARAELARKVAILWEEQLGDARESADAWRRVLRMKPGDADAQAGLERAKTNMLRKPDPATALPAPSNAATPVVATPVPAQVEKSAPLPPAGAATQPTAGMTPLPTAGTTPLPTAGTGALPTMPKGPPSKPPPSKPPPSRPSGPPSSRPPPPKPARPDIDFRRFDDDATVNTPISQINSLRDQAAISIGNLGAVHIDDSTTTDEKSRPTPPDPFSADLARTDSHPAASHGFEDEPTRVTTGQLEAVEAAAAGEEEEEEISAVDDAELIEEVHEDDPFTSPGISTVKPSNTTPKH
jgi:hypothetical protein